MKSNLYEYDGFHYKQKPFVEDAKKLVGNEPVGPSVVAMFSGGIAAVLAAEYYDGHLIALIICLGIGAAIGYFLWLERIKSYENRVLKIANRLRQEAEKYNRALDKT